jgi:hypothetical protein
VPVYTERPPRGLAVTALQRFDRAHIPRAPRPPTKPGPRAVRAVPRREHRPAAPDAAPAVCATPTGTGPNKTSAFAPEATRSPRRRTANTRSNPYPKPTFRFSHLREQNAPGKRDRDGSQGPRSARIYPHMVMPASPSPPWDGRCQRRYGRRQSMEMNSEEHPSKATRSAVGVRCGRGRAGCSRRAHLDHGHAFVPLQLLLADLYQGRPTSGTPPWR